MLKKVIQLTDIQFHTREYRPTGSFAKAEKKGRFYSSLPKGYEKDIDTTKRTMKFSIPLPPDLATEFERGEVAFMMPNGVPLYAGKDVIELDQKLNRKARRRAVHKNPTRTWHPGKRRV